tara:strand:- start:826 stop:1437 length:612 start_codon:yes stop_codon:yes gene_type:complete
MKWLGALFVFASCQQVSPEPAHTLEEAFEILHHSDHADLNRLTLSDLTDYQQAQARTLADSLSTQGEHFCISRQVDQEPKAYYVENTLVMLNFLSAYGATGPNYWDTNGDQEVNTSDLITILTGYDTQAPTQPDFSCYDIFDSFGEGNTWLTYTCEEDIEFGWLHRTPYDEINTPTYLGFNLYTFTIDVVALEQTEFYEYLRP